MAEKKAAKKAPAGSARRAAGKASETFSAEEKAAMKELARERRRPPAGKGDGEADVLAKIADMGARDRPMAERVHTIVKAAALELAPRTWYGMPAYAKDGNVICYFKPGEKFKMRYATFGFSDKASLDDGAMWPTEYALKELSADTEKRLSALVKKAAS
jgi:uncharacterized protein YdhG (YjbR/CyaY superfamily)